MVKTGRKDPKQSRSRHTVEAIFGAVTHILSREGVSSLTTNKIAEVAGVSVGSLYQYFKNKESIYEGILLKIIDQNLTRLEATIAGASAEDVKIRRIIELIIRGQFDSFQKMDRVSTVLLSYAPKVLPVSHFQKVDERLITFLSAQIEKHGLKIKPDNKEVALFVCAQAVRGVLVMTFLGKKTEEREIVVTELVDMLATYLERRD